MGLSVGELFTPLVHAIAKTDPQLQHKLRMAHMNKKVEQYLQEKIQAAIIFTIAGTFACTLLFLRFEISLFLLPLVVLGFLFFFMFVFVKSVDAVVSKRAKEIDREVLFAGRFLLVKLNAGTPLINALVGASHSYGVANRYFREIVRDIDLGTPIEQALENASRNTPSRKFRSILFQITNALKVGVDVSRFLEATLDEISQEQLVEIQRYGKKLNGVTMFYMLLAIVVPSLGLTLFILVASLVGIGVNLLLFSILAFFLLVVEFIFISVFRAIRPNLNI